MVGGMLLLVLVAFQVVECETLELIPAGGRRDRNKSRKFHAHYLCLARKEGKKKMLSSYVKLRKYNGEKYPAEV